MDVSSIESFAKHATKMNTPFFTIIIPTYNRGHIISRSINSIIAQTNTDWELIIIDDGSTDNTKGIVEHYQDHRIRYVWQENQERSAARNHGIYLAKGEWICFQDSDDEYLPEHLAILFEGIKNDASIRVIRTGLFIINKNGTKVKSEITQGKYNHFPFECIQCWAFQHEILKEKMKFYDQFVPMEDTHFLLQIGIKYKVTVLHEWTGNYYYDPHSSGGVGPKYELNLKNKGSAIDDILSWNSTQIIPSLKRSRCLIEILLLYGHIKYNRRKIFNSIIKNCSIFVKFPMEYIKLILKIIYVKIVEVLNLYKIEHRF